MTNSFYSCVLGVRVNREMPSTSPVTQSSVTRARCRFDPAVSQRVISSHAEPQASAGQLTGWSDALKSLYFGIVGGYGQPFRNPVREGLPTIRAEQRKLDR